MSRESYCRIALCLLIYSAVSGQTKVVNRKDRPPLIGAVTERQDDYLVQTKFGPVPVPKDQILSIEDYVTPEQEYQRRLSQINSDSAEDRYALGKWASENGLMERAEEQLTKALELKSEYPRASLLLRQVRAVLAAQPPEPTDQPGTKPGRPVAAGGGFDPDWLLTDQEVARIRLAELRLEDRTQIVFKNDVLNRFIDRMKARGWFVAPEDIAAFRGWPRTRQVRYILEVAGREDQDLTDDIVVKSDPRFMVDFRRRVWPVVMRSCATADCHGGTRGVGGFRLLNVAGAAGNVDYTNFLLLDSYERNGRKMIDRDYPEASLLLQYSLPRDKAEMPHPGKTRPTFIGASRRGSYLRLLRWLEGLKGPPHPRYDIQLRVPWLRKPPATTTQPAATQPSEGINADVRTP